VGRDGTVSRDGETFWTVRTPRSLILT